MEVIRDILKGLQLKRLSPEFHVSKWNHSILAIVVPKKSKTIVYSTDYYIETLEIESIENNMQVKCGGILRDNGEPIETAVTLKCLETV